MEHYGRARKTLFVPHRMLGWGPEFFRGKKTPFRRNVFDRNPSDRQKLVVEGSKSVKNPDFLGFILVSRYTNSFSFGAVFRGRWFRFRPKSSKKGAPLQIFYTLRRCCNGKSSQGSTSLQSAHLALRKAMH